MRRRLGRLARGLALCGAVVMQIGCNAGADKAAAEAAVAQFHDGFNGGSYHDIYLAASDEFHGATSESDFTAFLANVRAKAGRYESSHQSSWMVTNGTEGTVVTLSYEVIFSQTGAIEHFSWATN